MSRASLVIVSVVALGFAGAAQAGEWLDAGGARGEARPIVTLLESTGGVTTLHVELPGLWAATEVVDGREVLALEVDGGATLRQIDRPAIPTVGRLLAVPADASPWIELIDLDEVWVDAPPPAPAAPHPTRSGPGVTAHLDPAIYAGGATWPADVAVVEPPASMRGLTLARVELRLARYDFAAGQLGMLRSATVRVHHAGDDPWLARPELASRAFAEAVAPQVLNYTLPDTGVPLPPESMLVIVEDALIPAIDPLVDWKRQRGVQVTVTSLEELGGGLQQVQTAIDDAYASWDPPVTYVLLVGDNVPHHTGDYDYCASDYMFTTMDADLLPDVLISRIVGATPDDVATQVAKILAYEKTPPQGDDAAWLQKVTGAATDETGGAGIPDHARFDAIAASFEAYGYTHIDKYYVVDGTGTASNVQQALDDGRGWLFYLGHGSGYDFSSLQPPYSVSHVQQLNNAGMWPLVVDCSCLNGGFERPNDDCLAESMMKLGTADAPLGALGSFSSSTSTSWDPAGDLAEGVAYGFADHGHAYWGASAQWARSYVFQNWGSGMDSEWLFQQWVLFGDASLMIRSVPPIAPVVSYPDGFLLGETEFDVTVTVDDEPFEGATVALSKPGEVELVALTDADGVASFSFEVADKGPMEVVVTGRDLLPHIGTAEAGKLPSIGSGCSAAASPFSYNPAGLGFTGALTPTAPLGSAGALAAFAGLLLARRVRRR